MDKLVNSETICIFLRAEKAVEHEGDTDTNCRLYK